MITYESHIEFTNVGELIIRIQFSYILPFRNLRVHVLYHDFSSTFCTDTSRIRCCQVCGSVMANNMVSAINSCTFTNNPYISYGQNDYVHVVKICKCMKFYLKSVKRAVILYKEVFEFVDRKVISKLAQQIGQMNCLN